MMVPASPGTHFIIRKPCLTLGAFETIFYTMFGLNHTGQLVQRGIRRSIGKIVIVFHFAVSIRRTRDDQKFFGRIIPTAFRSGMTTSIELSREEPIRMSPH